MLFTEQKATKHRLHLIFVLILPQIGVRSPTKFALFHLTWYNYHEEIYSSFIRRPFKKRFHLQNRTRIHTRMSPKNIKTEWHSKKSTILPELLKLLHFFTLNTAVFSALNLWHSRGQQFDPAYLHHREPKSGPPV